MAKDRFSTPLEEKAYLVICQKRISVATLAGILGVSRPTAARAVASLRRHGARVVSVRDNGSWYYEVRDPVERARRRWRTSRLRGMAGCVTVWRPMAGTDEDEIIYGGA
jgi:biotin operon repressor